MNEIVRPFERDIAELLRFERTHDRYADRERESGKKSRTLLEFPSQRKSKAASRDRGPCPTAASASCRLPLGSESDTVHVAALRPPHQFRRRRFDLIDDLDGQRQRCGARFGETREPRPYLLGIEKIRGLEQPITAAFDAFEREARPLGILQYLRNAGPCQPYLGGKVLTGMEFPVGELAQ